MKKDAVRYRREKNIGIITLNRPERLNAINPDLLNDLIVQLNVARQDEDVVSVILTGAGRSFCAGEDLKETQSGKSLPQWKKEIDALQETQRIILKLGKPLIAAIRGYAVGGGLEFALSCDIRIAARDAKFGFPETGVGLTITSAGTKLISQLVGLGKAKELVFTGEIIDAQQALQIGLVNQVVSDAQLLEAALNMCERIGRNSPLSLKLSRMALDEGLHSSFEQILALEAEHLLACISAGNQERFVAHKLAEMKRKSQKG
ncbi:MAG: enoyl-CoA hydratase/isomerase family protein [Desulfobacterales bacterium]|nr:enoyl-CoA hydratase/isomerase family protein [Desulfobacterales bacterium]MDH3825964.1 enoyl-CoA hydratase/isomerase family protein [Desulfobacterales bacterium]MDH3879278.1 enoyl-CoA hydratase/isomerase family protein [Desulfobacterales bacterium]